MVRQRSHIFSVIMAVGVHEVTLSHLERIPIYAEHVLDTLPSHAPPDKGACENANIKLDTPYHIVPIYPNEKTSVRLVSCSLPVPSPKRIYLQFFKKIEVNV